MRKILAKVKFHDQIQTLVEADILGHLISDCMNTEVNSLVTIADIIRAASECRADHRAAIAWMSDAATV